MLKRRLLAALIAPLLALALAGAVYVGVQWQQHQVAVSACAGCPTT